MRTSKFLQALLINCSIGFAMAGITGVNPFLLAAIVNLIGAAMYYVSRKSNVVVFSGLAVEVWLPDVMNQFYPSGHFLTAARDLSSLVDNDKINLAEAGADPNVLKNNTVYPIGAGVATDVPLEVSLDYYDTDSSIVRNAIAIELAYDQRALYTSKHQKALLKRFGMDAAFAYAPQQDDPFNPVLSLAANDPIIDAIIDLRAKYDNLDDDGSDRHLVLSPSHLAKIAKEDKVLYKSIVANEGGTLYGFNIHTYSKNPLYIAATNQKAAFGVAYVAGTHKYSSFSFIGSEVMKAQGTFKMFFFLNSPDQKGDVFNFQMRGTAMSLRGKYSGAILQ